jgi:hypothetical protein
MYSVGKVPCMDSANYLRSVRTSSIWVIFVLCMHSISTSFVNNYYIYPIKYLKKNPQKTPAGMPYNFEKRLFESRPPSKTQNHRIVLKISMSFRVLYTRNWLDFFSFLRSPNIFNKQQ